MNTHGGGFPQGPRKVMVPLAGQTLFVEGMAPFMGRGQEGGKGLTRHYPAGDPKIIGTEGAGKRMG